MQVKILANCLVFTSDLVGHNSYHHQLLSMFMRIFLGIGRCVLIETSTLSKWASHVCIFWENWKVAGGECSQ